MKGMKVGAQTVGQSGCCRGWGGGGGGQDHVEAMQGEQEHQTFSQ